MSTLQYAALVADKKRRAFATFPAAHKRAPVTGEIFASKDAAIERLKDWSCTQGFAAVLGHGEHKKRQIQEIKCSRHGKKTRNTRKLTEETRERPLSHVNYNQCPYKIKIRYYTTDAEWRINVVNDTHNHEMLNDPFQFTEHHCRDPDRNKAKDQGRDLITASLPFSEARRVMRTKGLRLSSKEYYNLRDKGGKRSAQEELQYALRTLETKGYKVRIKERYLVQDNIRQSQEIEFFFFASPRQITLARQFASHFVVITDATFNTNENCLPLSVIVCVTNTLKTVPIAYCFIESESTEAFLFMHDCMKDLFFYDNCRGPAVVLGDFAAGLTAAMMKKRTNVLTISTEQEGTVAQAGMDVAWELSSQMDELGSECFLQLCNWHAAEAIKKRLTREGYPLEKRKVLAELVWNWIKSATLTDLERNRGLLLDQLHQKEQNYLVKYYQKQEHQFVTAYTKELPNLGCKSTQRGESSHPAVKNPTNRHTPIGQSVEKIAEEVDEIIHTYEYELERQKKNNPRSIDASRSFFQDLTGYITHQAIELVHRELIAAKQWVFDVQDEVSQEPSGNICENGCQLPKQYGLPCKCWLYRSVVADLPIPLSLLHPRWLIRAPEVVVGWQMTFDLSITPASYALLEGKDDARSQSSDQLDNEDDRPPPPTSVQSRYDRRGLDMMEAEAFEAYELHKKIPEGHRAEKYARELTKAIQKVNRSYNEKYARPGLPQSFAVAKKNDENLTYRKNGSKRRAMTGREAADAEDLATRRRIRAEAIEKERNERFAEQVQMDKEAVSDFSQRNWPEEYGKASSSRQQEEDNFDKQTSLDPIFPNNAGDSDVEYLGTQPLQNPGQSPSEDRINTASPLVSEPSLDNFANIDDFEDFSPLSPTSPRLPPPLMRWPDRRSQQKTLVIPDDPTPSAVTRARRVVKAKSFKQQKLESQQRRDADLTAQRAAKRREAAARKEAKMMKPRKEDVSQLADRLRSSSL